jgi:hypothetical protein
MLEHTRVRCRLFCRVNGRVCWVWSGLEPDTTDRVTKLQLAHIPQILIDDADDNYPQLLEELHVPSDEASTPAVTSRTWSACLSPLSPPKVMPVTCYRA